MLGSGRERQKFWKGVELDEGRAALSPGSLDTAPHRSRGWPDGRQRLLRYDKTLTPGYASLVLFRWHQSIPQSEQLEFKMCSLKKLLEFRMSCDHLSNVTALGHDLIAVFLCRIQACKHKPLANPPAAECGGHSRIGKYH